MADPKPLILVVEDQKDLASLTSTQLETAGMVCQVAYTADAAFRFLKRNHVNLMLLDINLPDRSGTDLLEHFKRQILRFIDDHHKVFTRLMASESQVVNGINQLILTTRWIFHTEFREN